MLANSGANQSFRASLASVASQALSNATLTTGPHAKDTPTLNNSLPGQPFVVPASRMFAYPTRLFCAWEPRPVQIHLPEVAKPSSPIAITVRPGLTQASNLQPRRYYRHALKSLYQQLALPLRLPNSYVLDSRFETDQNIAHIVDNIVTRFLLAKRIEPDLSNLTMILRRNASPMMKQVCQLLHIPFVCTDRRVQGNIVTVEAENRSADCPITFEPYYRSLFESLDFADYQPDTPKRVFIARKHRRKLTNEAEVEQLLQAYGFVKVYYEDISIQQQWSIARNAEVVVGVHGAALSSLVFNAHQVKLLEIFHPGYVVDLYRDSIAAIGGKWAAVVGQLHPDVIQALDFEVKPRQFALADMTIDLGSLQGGLDYLEVGS